MQEGWEIPEAETPQNTPVLEGKPIDKEEIDSAEHLIKFLEPKSDDERQLRLMAKLLHKTGGNVEQARVLARKALLSFLI